MGHYLIPEDAVDPNLNMDAVTHRLEGVCWGEEQVIDYDTGELVDHFHVVRAHSGALAFSVIPGGRIGTVHPPSPATIDGILKLAGRHLTEKGRHSEKRVARVVDVLLGVVRNMPAVEAPSIFEPLPGAAEHPEDDAGWLLGGSGAYTLVDGDIVDATTGKLLKSKASAAEPSSEAVGLQGAMLAQLLHRYDTVDVDHVIGNEVRRAARAKGLPFLAEGAVLSLAEVVAYDEILRRWERAARSAS